MHCIPLPCLLYFAAQNHPLIRIWTLSVIVFSWVFSQKARIVVDYYTFDWKCKNTDTSRHISVRVGLQTKSARHSAFIMAGNQTGGSDLLLKQVGGEERNVREMKENETMFCLVTWHVMSRKGDIERRVIKCTESWTVQRSKWVMNYECVWGTNSQWVAMKTRVSGESPLPVECSFHLCMEFFISISEKIKQNLGQNKRRPWESHLQNSRLTYLLVTLVLPTLLVGTKKFSCKAEHANARNDCFIHQARRRLTELEKNAIFKHGR